MGLPSFIGRDKKACFVNMKEFIWARMQGWKEKLLSQVGKEVMIKVVIQSIPAYSMSVFKLPTSLCKEIEMMIRRFWWGQHDAKKIHSFEQVFYLSDCSVFHHCLGLMAEKESAS